MLGLVNLRHLRISLLTLAACHGGASTTSDADSTDTSGAGASTSSTTGQPDSAGTDLTSPTSTSASTSTTTSASTTSTSTSTTTSTTASTSTSATETGSSSVGSGCEPVGEVCLPLPDAGTTSGAGGDASSGATSDASTGTTGGTTGDDPCAALADELALEAMTICGGAARLGDVFAARGACCLQFYCPC